MKTKLTQMVGCEYPIVAFSHCRDVIAAVTKAGGFGMFGCARYTPEELEAELDWVDDTIGQAGYGLDFLLPAKFDYDSPEVSELPAEHRTFIDSLMTKYGIPKLGEFQREMVRAEQQKRKDMITAARKM